MSKIKQNHPIFKTEGRDSRPKLTRTDISVFDPEVFKIACLGRRWPDFEVGMVERVGMNISGPAWLTVLFT